MAAAFSTHANACVAEYSDHNYYMFSVFNRHQTSPAYLYDIASYWQKYAGNTSSVNLSFYAALVQSSEIDKYIERVSE